MRTIAGALLLMLCLSAAARADDPPCLTKYGWNNDCVFYKGSPLVVTDDSDNPEARFLSGFRKGISFDALAMSVTGGCAQPAATLLNNGPEDYLVNCTTSSASFYSSIPMPKGWDASVALTFDVYVVVDDPAPAGTYQVNFSCGCRGDNETISSAIYSTPDANAKIALTILSGDANALRIGSTGPVTCGGSCSAGDVLFWKGTIDPDETTSSPASDIGILNVKVRYAVDGTEDTP